MHYQKYIMPLCEVGIFTHLQRHDNEVIKGTIRENILVIHAKKKKPGMSFFFKKNCRKII
jgi:hypothetical protein